VQQLREKKASESTKNAELRGSYKDSYNFEVEQQCSASLIFLPASTYLKGYFKSQKKVRKITKKELGV